MLKYKFFLILISLVFAAAACNRKQAVINPPTPAPTPVSVGEPEKQRIEFASINPIFRFSGNILAEFQVEYVPQIESISIKNNSESQIFIRYFNANTFLTLTTVDIFSKEEAEVNGHPAVRYEIKKKPGVANFPNQPSWRNEQHKLIDIRFSPANPTTFYVFAYNPKLDARIFEEFISSLVFHNDKTSLRQPIDRVNERVTKKPFGIKVSPQNSPVSPERFTGYHNAVDYEAFEEEKDIEVPVFVVCGGKILQIRTASGYGGFIVQECEIENQKVTVNYGHVDIGSAKFSVGQYAAPGVHLANLGQGFSSETDGERKHLHLGIHKGSSVDIRGYINNDLELVDWIDFRTLIRK